MVVFQVVVVLVFQKEKRIDRSFFQKEKRIDRSFPTHSKSLNPTTQTTTQINTKYELIPDKPAKQPNDPQLFGEKGAFLSLFYKINFWPPFVALMGLNYHRGSISLCFVVIWCVFGCVGSKSLLRG